MNMFCGKCGNPLNDDVKFCPKCGTAINAGKKKFIIASALCTCICICIIVAAGIAFQVSARVSNLWHRQFSSPEKYYQYVEGKAAKNAYDTAGELYSALLLESLNLYDKSVNASLSVELSDDGQELLSLAGLSGVDMSWLQQGEARADLSIKDSLLRFGLGASVNKNDLISGNMVMDLDQEEAYFQIPDLTKTCLGIYIRDCISPNDYWRFEEFLDLQASSKDLQEALPSEKDFKKLLEKYTDIAIGCINDVSMNKGKTLKAGGIQQSCTELIVTIDSSTAQDIAEAVLTEMKDDKELKNLIVDIAEANGYDGDDAYDSFQDNIERSLGDLQYVSMGTEIVQKVYVDGIGEIKGRATELPMNGSDMTIKILAPEKGGEIGVEASAEADGQSIEISGSGKKKQDKITGDFNLRYNGASILDIKANKLNITDFTRGRLNGEIEISASPAISSLLMGAYGPMEYARAMSMITDLKAIIKAKSSKDSANYDVNIIYKDQDIATIGLSTEIGNGSKASVPDDVIMLETSGDLQDWLSQMEWDALVTRMEDADFPLDLINMVEGAQWR